MPFTVTPWDVEGTVDYDKLIKKFGTKPITSDLLKKLARYKQLPALLRRGFFFSHRDLDLVLKDVETGKSFFLYTGIALGGSMHVGHLIPFLISKWFQDAFKVNCYIQIPDEEKFLARGIPLEKIDEIVADNLLDIAAVGFDPNRTFVFQNREYAGHLYEPAVKIAKKVTSSTARAVFGFTNKTNIGWMFYPAMQMVPTFFESRRCLIPAGIDQDNYWRVQRDLAEGLGGKKAAAIHNKFLPPLTGMGGKMSSSASQNAIFLSDSPAEVKSKVMKHAFSGGGGSLEEHRKQGGRPEVDVAYQWLHILFEESDAKIKSLEKGYRSGKITTGEMKLHLIKKLNAFLATHNKDRKPAAVKRLKYTGRLAKKMWE